MPPKEKDTDCNMLTCSVLSRLVLQDEITCWSRCFRRPSYGSNGQSQVNGPFSVLSCIAVCCLMFPGVALSGLFLPCLALPCLALSCRVVSCLAASCRAVPCRVVYCHVFSCGVLSCPVVSCLALAGLVFCSLGLGCLFSSCVGVINPTVQLDLQLFVALSHLVSSRVVLSFHASCPAFAALSASRAGRLHIQG